MVNITIASLKEETWRGKEREVGRKWMRIKETLARTSERKTQTFYNAQQKDALIFNLVKLNIRGKIKRHF